MYLAKERGKNNVQFYTSALADEAVRQFTLETELRQAVDRDQWVLHYQPLVDLKTGALCGMEALLRWQHPKRGLVAPGEFIGVAEDRGLIITIGRWVLCEACRQVRAWRDAGYEVPTVSVNVSARQFGDDSLFDVIADATRRHGLPSGALSIELTESVLMTEPQRSAATLGRLADAGIAAAIDDFGTGYSSLAYLKRFAATTVKIDRSFIDGLPGSRDDLAITQAVLAMARTLGLQVVAEGVETVAQRDLLTALGCERAQGYLFGRPMPASDMERRLAKQGTPKRLGARKRRGKA
jgi:EAL domain-containing protein (putative c-di-GMP-specific phosphodiesterase class I)